jgi:hypothetical protein
VRVSLYFMGLAIATAITGIFLAALSCAVGPSLLSPAGMKGIVLLGLDAAAAAFIAIALTVHARSPSAHADERKQQEAAARLALVGMAILVGALILVPYLFLGCASG